MKALGIDYGEKNIGIAISDEEGMMAFPRTTIRNTTSVLDDIVRMCEEEKIETIVLGVPVSFSGLESEQARITVAFGTDLAGRVGISVVHENEVLSSKMADMLGSTKAKRDQNAAAIILQTWLDRIKKEYI